MAIPILSSLDVTGNIDMGAGKTVDGVDISALPTSFAPSNAEANVQADWDETTTTSDAFILNKPTSFNNLNAVDDRDIAPEDLTYSDDFRIYFADKGQIEGGSNTSDYQDLLVLNSYTDATGGDANALAFDKNTFRILHYQADQADTNWGTAKQIAYTDQIPTDFVSAANGGTFSGDVTVNDNIKVTGSIMRGSITTATNSSNTHTCTLADNDNFNIAVANAATTIALTVVSADIGKSGIITITNPASVGSLSFVALPSYMLTPSGATVNFVTTANAVSVISYYVLATDKVLCNYIGNFA